MIILTRRQQIVVSFELHDISFTEILAALYNGAKTLINGTNGYLIADTSNSVRYKNTEEKIIYKVKCCVPENPTASAAIRGVAFQLEICKHIGGIDAQATFLDDTWICFPTTLTPFMAITKVVVYDLKESISGKYYPVTFREGYSVETALKSNPLRVSGT